MVRYWRVLLFDSVVGVRLSQMERFVSVGVENEVGFCMC